MNHLRTYVVVAIGGMIGSVTRYWLGNLGGTLLTDSFPWGIVIVNIIGCFIIGFFSEATGSNGMLDVSPDMRNFVIVGICGGFTTFSSFSLETMVLALRGHAVEAAANVLISLLCCLLSVAFGVWLVRFTNLVTNEVEEGKV